MIPILSLVTSVKDYLEVVHKLIEYDSIQMNYTEFGTIFTYFLISVKTFLVDLFSLAWLKNIWSLPVIMPDISSAMVSEISVLDGYFHNAFNFLETPVSYGEQNSALYGLEKFTIGLLNSLFLFLPTSTAHIITLRRFVMQGLDAGYVSGLGTIAGNVLWLASVIFGWRFFVIPWLSLDILRYLLGFVLLVKYMWDSYNEQKTGPSSGVLDDTSKRKFFLLNFLLALTEQTSIYPFISNLSISPETSILESFPADTYSQFIFIHFAYLLGITLGCFSLLHFTCWFWENPAFKIYMWVISSFKVSTSFYYKALNFTFLYLTMISAISSIPYYGLDYTITNPLGYVSDDRIIQDKLVLETSFLGGKASDRNTRRNRGRHGRRERWKRRIRKYRTFDASLYDQGIYDLFTIEDLNYGFDRFWLRRKLRNHRVRFRFFPGPWMRNFKKQLAKPRLESYTGPRSEFFRILFEQVYHPSFHAYESKRNDLISSTNRNQKPTVVKTNERNKTLQSTNQIQLANQSALFLNTQNDFSIYSRLDSKHRSLLTSSSKLNKETNQPYKVKQNLIHENSTLRKFVRKLDTRLKTSSLVGVSSQNNSLLLNKENPKVYSKQWKHLFSKIYHDDLSNKSNSFNKSVHRNLANNAFKNGIGVSSDLILKQMDALDNKQTQTTINLSEFSDSVKKQNVRKNISKKDYQILRYRSLLSANQNNLLNSLSNTTNNDKNISNKTLQSSQNSNDPMFLLHPLKFYLQKESAFKRKLRYYSPSLFRKFSVENNAPYFRVMMRRYFYNYKPSLRWERTMKVASMRKARRKTTRIPRKLQLNSTVLASSSSTFGKSNSQIEDKNNLVNTGNKDENLANFAYGEAVNTSLLIASKRLQKPTYNYSVVSKRASRYRYQIYKDVLQHWYYSPFNRLLLKLDVDSFIRRQPNAHFLTAKEENLLHLRRFLISEHYNTLRWYTNMEHYRSMKTRLGGGTKSFASRVYNQQFSGTFKKIRHLFAITPSQGQDNVILKFDQPLYNEVQNNNKNPLLNQLIIHEELALDFNPNTSNMTDGSSVSTLTKDVVPNNSTRSSNGDILSQSQNIVRDYLTNSRSAREEYIKKLLDEKNYTQLTQFLYKGQKTRGTEPTTNQRLFNNQEKDALLTPDEKNEIDQQLKSMKLRQFMMDNNLMEDLYVTYLKKWKRKMNDQESLKNYLTQRVEKREKRKQKKEKHLLNKLKRLENWLVLSNKTDKSISLTKSPSFDGGKSEAVDANKTNGIYSTQNDVLTTGLQKAILDGMSTLKDVDPTVKAPSEKTFWKVLLLSKIKQKTINQNLEKDKLYSNYREAVVKQKQTLSTYKDLSLRFNDLKATQQTTLSKDIQTSTSQLRNLLINIENNPNKSTTTKKSLSIIQTKVAKLYSTFTNTIPSYLGFQKVTNLFKPIKRKSLKSWRNKERASGKQKRSRKEFKMLNKKVESKDFSSNLISDRNQIEFALQNSSSSGLLDPTRKKRDLTSSDSSSSVKKAKTSFEAMNESNNKDSFGFFNRKGIFFEENSFKRKRSPQRRARVRRNRGVFKKRTLSDYLKKDIKNFYKENKLKLAMATTDKTNVFISKMNTNLYASPSLSASTAREQATTSDTVPLKQRKSKQRKQRVWKQKRSKFSQKRRKYRKRKRYSLGKIRILSKQLKRVKNKIEIQNWWWKQFVPSIQASTDALWQIEKDKLIQQKLAELSSAEILERDQMFNSNALQIGNKDFKPLALPETIRLKDNLTQNSPLGLSEINKGNSLVLPLPLRFTEGETSGTPSVKMATSSPKVKQPTDTTPATNLDVVNRLYGNLFISSDNQTNNQKPFKSFMEPNTMLPFYAGWDESLRKFVVTNRMLSRRDAGFEMKQLDPSTTVPALKALTNVNDDFNSKTSSFEFSQAPVQGMNAATTLYWQIPFTTYDPDQFFALGMDGFSPIGWRKFLFRHSILKTWLNTIGSKDLSKPYLYREAVQAVGFTTTTNDSDVASLSEGYAGASSNKTQKSLIVKSKTSLINTLKTNRNTPFFKRSERTFDAKNTSRRLKKRYRRVKKHPRTPVWFPSGPLLNQVLPVHYIYVFYKRARLPRDRYLKRRLLNTKTVNKSEGFNTLKSFATDGTAPYMNYDFTLRKRLKPKRKYHLKRDFYSSNVVIPRRFKFISTSPLSSNRNDLDLLNNGSPLRWRPLSSLKINKPIVEIVKEQKFLRSKQRRKDTSSKQQTPLLRVKQLRRRVQRQVLRSVWRYRPRAGGFVWPGDYLKLELVKAPKLQTSGAAAPKGTFGEETQNLANLTNSGTTGTTDVSQTLRSTSSKAKRKKKRTLVEWQIQPKKYLYEKHNIKVLKKKLEKSFRSDKLRQKIKELNYKI